VEQAVLRVIFIKQLTDKGKHGRCQFVRLRRILHENGFDWVKQLERLPLQRLHYLRLVGLHNRAETVN
jgi:hypothetical protein